MPSSMPDRADGKFRFPDGAVVLSVMSLSVLIASLVLPAEGFPGIDTCSFHALTALPCPGCGLTRAFCAISHGQFREAWSLHPFSFLFYLGVLAGAAAPILDRCFPALSSKQAAMTLRVGVLVLAIAMLCFGGWRAMEQVQASSSLSSSRPSSAEFP